MESYKTCPICLQIPEQEIYQCTNGHTVCNMCIEKLQTCPQCRIPFGDTKIRTRALEEILNEQEFDCKFKKNGCSNRCKRIEISKHASSCSHNPDYIPLCKKIGFKDCSYSIGCKGREEIIEHFKNSHGALFESVASCIICLKEFNSIQAINKPKTCRPIIQSCGNTNKSPLFLILAKINSPLGYVSFSCVHIWGTENVQNCVEFCTHGDFDSEALPMSWKLSVLSMKDSESVLDAGLVLASVPLVLKQYLHSNKDFAVKTILRTVHSMDFGTKNKKETWVFTKPIDNDNDSILVESRSRKKLVLVKKQDAATAAVQLQNLSPTVLVPNVVPNHPTTTTYPYQRMDNMFMPYSSPHSLQTTASVSKVFTPSHVPTYSNASRSNSMRVSNKTQGHLFQSTNPILAIRSAAAATNISTTLSTNNLQ